MHKAYTKHHSTILNQFSTHFNINNCPKAVDTFQQFPLTQFPCACSLGVSFASSALTCRDELGPPLGFISRLRDAVVSIIFDHRFSTSLDSTLVESLSVCYVTNDSIPGWALSTSSGPVCTSFAWTNAMIPWRWWTAYELHKASFCWPKRTQPLWIPN